VALSVGIAFRPLDVTRESLRLELRCGSDVTPVNFRLLDAEQQDASLAWSPEAQFAAGIIPAMRSGFPLRIDGLLDAKFHGNIAAVQTLLGCWNGDLRAVEVQGTSGKPRWDPAPARQALFFSGGVDSTFSLLRHPDAITDLVYVHGFDVPLAETGLRRAVSGYLRRVAGMFGLNLIEIETDLRSLLDRHCSWRRAGHGVAIAAVAHLLQERFSRVFISSTYSYDILVPCGTHPLLDPLWSTASLEFVHDGADTSRAGKVVRVARNADARRLLRVCWKAPRADRVNCCRCEKCLRTMVALQAVGELHAEEAFPLPLERSAVRRLRLTPAICNLWCENRDLLLQNGRDPELLATVERLIEPNPFRRWKQQIKAWNRQRRLRRRQCRKQEISIIHDKH
jgi:hypothetical protein